MNACGRRSGVLCATAFYAGTKMHALTAAPRDPPVKLCRAITRVLAIRFEPGLFHSISAEILYTHLGNQVPHNY